MRRLSMESHKHGMLVPNAMRRTRWPDQKAVVRSGYDVLVHMVQGGTYRKKKKNPEGRTWG